MYRYAPSGMQWFALLLLLPGMSGSMRTGHGEMVIMFQSAAAGPSLLIRVGFGSADIGDMDPVVIVGMAVAGQDARSLSGIIK